MIFDEIRKVLNSTTKKDLIIISNSVYYHLQTDLNIGGHILKDCQKENPIEFLSNCYKFINSLRINRIIAVGGGSIIDLAKILSATSSLHDLSFNRIAKKYHLAVIPTTFATGSETSAGAIYKSVEGIKKGLRGEEIIPDEVIYEPKIFQHLTERLEKESFFDLFTHAFETGISKKTTEKTISNSIKIINQLILWHKAGNLQLQSMTDSDLNLLCHLSYISGVNLKLSSTCSPHRLQYVTSSINGLNHSTGLYDIYFRWFPRVKKYIKIHYQDNQFNQFILNNIADIKNFIEYFKLTKPINYAEVEVEKMLYQIDENRLSNDPIVNTKNKVKKLLSHNH